MSQKYAALGTSLAHEVTQGSGTFTAIAGLTSMDGPGGDTEELDSSSHDSAGGFRENLASFRDPGELDIAGYFDPNEATHDATDGIASFWIDAQTRLWKMRTPTGAALALEDFMSANAWVRSFRLSTPFDGMFGFTNTLRFSGLPTFL